MYIETYIHTHTSSIILTEQILPQLLFWLIILKIKMVTSGHGCLRLALNIHLSDQCFWLFPSSVLQEVLPSFCLLYQVLSHSLRWCLLTVLRPCADPPVLCCTERCAAILWSVDPSLLHYTLPDEERLWSQVHDQGLSSPLYHQPEVRNAQFM